MKKQTTGFYSHVSSLQRLNVSCSDFWRSYHFNVRVLVCSFSDSLTDTELHYLQLQQLLLKHFYIFLCCAKKICDNSIQFCIYEVIFSRFLQRKTARATDTEESQKQSNLRPHIYTIIWVLAASKDDTHSVQLIFLTQLFSISLPISNWERTWKHQSECGQRAWQRTERAVPRMLFFTRSTQARFCYRNVRQ